MILLSIQAITKFFHNQGMQTWTKLQHAPRSIYSTMQQSTQEFYVQNKRSIYHKDIKNIYFKQIIVLSIVVTYTRQG